MKQENNSVKIGKKNKITNSVIGSYNQITNEDQQQSEKWYNKLFWKIIIPVVVGVAVAAICLWIGLK